jgi:hypothetical protein
MSMKKFYDTIGNRSRDLPVCSAVLQPLQYHVPPPPATKTGTKTKRQERERYGKTVQNLIMKHEEEDSRVRQTEEWGGMLLLETHTEPQNKCHFKQKKLT